MFRRVVLGEIALVGELHLLLLFGGFEDLLWLGFEEGALFGQVGVEFCLLFLGLFLEFGFEEETLGSELGFVELTLVGELGFEKVALFGEFGVELHLLLLVFVGGFEDLLSLGFEEGTLFGLVGVDLRLLLLFLFEGFEDIALCGKFRIEFRLLLFDLFRGVGDLSLKVEDGFALDLVALLEGVVFDPKGGKLFAEVAILFPGGTLCGDESVGEIAVFSIVRVLLGGEIVVSLLKGGILLLEGGVVFR